MKATTTNLKKLEDLFTAQNYTVRYEKGHFQSGWCVVEAKRVVIVNKFYDTEGRIQCMLDILSKIEVHKDMFSEEQGKLFDSLYE